MLSLFCRRSSWNVGLKSRLVKAPALHYASAHVVATSLRRQRLPLSARNCIVSPAAYTPVASPAPFPLRAHCQVRALANDTVGTMEAAAYTHPDTAMGVILGTGTNAAYIEKTSKVGKWGGAPSDEMVINTEWGNLDMILSMNGTCASMHGHNTCTCAPCTCMSQFISRSPVGRPHKCTQPRQGTLALPYTTCRPLLPLLPLVTHISLPYHRPPTVSHPAWQTSTLPSMHRRQIQGFSASRR